MRMTTEFVAFAMARPGSFDSAAAIVAISAPTMEKMIARTLMPANQYSNSPYDLTENRFVAVIRIISPRASNQSGASTQRVSSFAPATASNPTTMTQKYQYSQPTEKPAQP